MQTWVRTCKSKKIVFPHISFIAHRFGDIHALKYIFMSLRVLATLDFLKNLLLFVLNSLLVSRKSYSIRLYGWVKCISARFTILAQAITSMLGN